MKILSQETLQQVMWESILGGCQLDSDERDDNLLGIDSCVLVATDHAKLTSIVFAEWIKDEYEWHDGWQRWIPQGAALIAPDERLTTEQLYQTFLQSLNQ